MRKTGRRESFLPRKVRQAFSNGIVYLLLLAGSGFMLFPLFWMLSTSLKTMEEANSPRITWWPAEPQLDAYRQVLTDSRWLLYFSNSAFVTTLAVLGTLVSVAAVAYAFSRIQWPGRNIVFFLMLSTLMLPYQTTLVPQYVMFNKIGWVGTYNPIIIPGFFAGGALYIFLLRQFMLGLPKELDEAALIDGANHFQIWWHIILPLCKPALATIAVFLFVGNWNALQAPLIYLQRANMYTLPVVIANLINPQVRVQPWPLIMAASALTMIPLVIVFFFTQRYILESVALTGTKG
ncbi:MAG: carbohydrate ABC transporter permease [Thermoflexales bacterium]|nr:carbohydrate ABC transporter permease [Thermoflexales bacterium]